MRTSDALQIFPQTENPPQQLVSCRPFTLSPYLSAVLLSAVSKYLLRLLELAHRTPKLKMVRAIAVPVAFVSGIAATYGYTQLSPEQQTELLDTIKGALPAVPLPELPDISAIPGVEQVR